MKATLLTFCVFIFSTSISAQSDISYDHLKKDMRKEIAHLMKKHEVTGLSVALVKNQEVVWSEGFGYSNLKKGQKATDSTIYKVGSISKTFTALGVMKLVEKQNISLDSALSLYIPEFNIRSRFGEEDITPRMLLSHHSGLPGDLMKGFDADPKEDFREVIPTLNQQFVAYPPNHIYSYSNIGISLMGILIERRQPLEFTTYMDSLVFEPLGMSNSSFNDSSLQKRFVSNGYKNGKEASDLSIRDVPAGCMSSNVLDMAKFMKMVFQEQNGFISDSLLGDMLTPQSTDAPMDLTNKMGLGFFVGNSTLDYAGAYVRHGGDTKLFHAQFGMLLDQKLGVVILTNSSGGGAIRSSLTKKILKSALALEGITDPEEKEKNTLSKVNSKDLSAYDEYLGTYSIGDGTLTFKRKNSKLVTQQGKFKIDLLPNNKGTFTPRIKLLKVFPVTLKSQQIGFKKIAEKYYLTTSDELVGIRIDNYKIHPEWTERVGSYKLINQGNDVSFPQDISLEIEDNLLKLSFHYSGKNTLVLETLDSTHALNMGMGRSSNESIFITQSSEGEDLLNFSGYQFSLITE